MMPPSPRSLSPPSPRTENARLGKRLSLRDMEQPPGPRGAMSEDGYVTPLGGGGASDRMTTRSSQVERRQRMTGSSAGSKSTRQGNLTSFSNPLRKLEDHETSGDQRFRENLKQALNSRTTLGLTVIGSTAALVLAVLRTARWQEWHQLAGIRTVQLALAVAFASELIVRFHVWGTSCLTCWVDICDSYVIVMGLCLSGTTRWGSAVLFLRIVRVWAVLRGLLTVDSQEEEAKLDENPAVQLYHLVMRTVRDSSSMYTAEEKKIVRNLLSLLAHQQIYVDTTLQRGNEDYWKEYGDEPKPRARPSIAFGSQDIHGRSSRFSSRSFISAPMSPTASHMLGLAMQLDGSHTVIGSVQDETVGRVLAKVDHWDFDPFELDTVTKGHPLAALSGYLFAVKYNFFECFDFSKPHFTNFMVEVEQGYGSGEDPGTTNLYHNRRHATDVTQAVHYFLTVCNLGQHLQDIEAVALVLGALIHDVKHPGKSNAFLTKTGHALAITYNDISILENFHLSEAFLLLRKDDCNFFRDVAPSTAQEIRRIMVSMVLATDLKMHFDILGEFNSHLADVQENVLVDEGMAKTYVSAMKICIKSADISHAARATELHMRWTRVVIEEFFLQGDEEKALGLEPSPLCDRNNTDIASSQKNFIGFLVKPLLKSWVSFLDCPAAETCYTNLEGNEAMWVLKERMGDNSFDHVKVPGVPSPPPPPPPKNPPRRPSRIMAVFGSGVGNNVNTGTGVGGSIGGQVKDDADEAGASKQAAASPRRGVLGVALRVSTANSACDSEGGDWGEEKAVEEGQAWKSRRGDKGGSNNTVKSLGAKPTASRGGQVTMPKRRATVTPRKEADDTLGEDRAGGAGGCGRGDEGRDDNRSGGSFPLDPEPRRHSLAALLFPRAASPTSGTTRRQTGGSL